MLKEQRAQQVSAHDAATRAFEATYPADPRALVAMRLRAFLEVSKDVAVDARLVTQDKVQRFQDPALEAKPRGWKMCFRAGRPATDAARQFAGNWLSALEAQGVK